MYIIKEIKILLGIVISWLIQNFKTTLKFKKELLLVDILSFLSFLYLALRCYFVELSNDEAVSFSIIKGDIGWLLDANNHWLNTIWGGISFLLFGYSEFFLRILSLFAFVVSYFSLRKFLESTEKVNLLNSFLAFILLFGNAFYFEYFSSFRGYGLSFAFTTLCIYYTTKFIKTNNIEFVDFVIFSLSSLIAFYANYSSFTLIVVLEIFVFYQYFKLYKFSNIKPYITKAALFFPGVANIYYLKKIGALYIGGKRDFYQDTLSSLFEHTFLFLPKEYFIYIVALVIVLFIFAIVLFLKLSKESKFLFLILISYIGFINFIYYAVGVGFPVSRTSLYLYILISFFVISLFWSNVKLLFWGLNSILAIFLVWNFSKSISLENTTGYGTQHGRNVVEYIKTKHKTSDFKIACHGFLNHTVNFYLAKNFNTNIWYSSGFDKTKEYDYIFICTDVEVPENIDKYKKVARFDYNFTLFEKK